MDLKIEIDGLQASDLVNSLQEVLKRVQDGFTSGFDSSDSASYSFTTEGSPMETFFVGPASLDEDALTIDEVQEQFEQHSSFDEVLSACSQHGQAVFGILEGGTITRIQSP